MRRMVFVVGTVLLLVGCAASPDSYKCRDTYEQPPTIDAENDAKCRGGDGAACDALKRQLPNSRACTIAL